MNMVKKLSVFCLVLCLTLCLAACVAGGEDTDGGSTTTTASTTTTTASNLSTYTVTVKTENGEPVVGVMVQICKELCVPTVTDANGVATWQTVEDTYKVSFLPNQTTLEGYAVEENYYFDGDAKEMVITLKAAE
ncbi:MAG: hypothetical protein IK954_04110 [Clostridia bacterium]|nr:hypothetical protein [Clostridia bacterium]